MTQTTADPHETVSIQRVATSKSAGHVIVDTLVAHGIKRAHIVPGESFLDVLDGLHDSPIETIVCRHEGGATYMAEAVSAPAARSRRCRPVSRAAPPLSDRSRRNEPTSSKMISHSGAA